MSEKTLLVIDEASKLSPFVELYAALDLKEQAFVDEYIESLNATLAARRVWGVQAAKQKGYALLQRADVAATIAAGLREQNERTHNDPDRLIRELMLVAYADPRDLIDETGEYLALRDLAPELRRAIASIEVLHEKVTTEYVPETKDGQAPVLKGEQKVTTTTRVLRYKLVAKTPALELLGRRLKMFTDRLELDASDSLSALIRAAFNRPSPGISDIKNSAEPQA